MSEKLGDYPRWLSSKESAYNARGTGDQGLISG